MWFYSLAFLLLQEYLYIPVHPVKIVALSVLFKRFHGETRDKRYDEEKHKEHTYRYSDGMNGDACQYASNHAACSLSVVTHVSALVLVEPILHSE
jgi:hypothetical protein